MEQSRSKLEKITLSIVTYIDKYYAIPTCILCILCIVGVAIIGGVTFRTNEWSYGIIVLLMLALALMTMAIISIVAMYREISRLHARKFPDDTLDLMNQLIKKVEELQSLSTQNKENMFEKMNQLENKVEELRPQHAVETETQPETTEATTEQANQPADN